MKHMNMKRLYAAHAMLRGLRVYAEADIVRLSEKAQALSKSIGNNRAKLAAMMGKEGYKAEDGKAVYDEIERDVALFNQVKACLEDAQSGAAGRVAERFNAKLAGVAARNREAIGGLYRAMITGMAPAEAVRQALSLPTIVESGTATGGYLLPKNVSDELIRDIAEDNSILEEITVTQITGLVMPKVATTDNDSDDIADGADAAAASMTASQIVFGRYPYAKTVAVPNSLLADTDTALEAYIDTRHTEMMRHRMCSRLFAAEAAGDYAHMSVLNAETGIASVSGEDLLSAIMNALAALPIKPKGVYKVALNMSSWMGMVKTLANGATALFGAPTKEILGFEPVLCNYVPAKKALCGNLKAIHLNYDSAIAYEPQRDAKKGITDFVLRTAYDIRITDAAQLRLAEATA